MFQFEHELIWSPWLDLYFTFTRHHVEFTLKAFDFGLISIVLARYDPNSAIIRSRNTWLIDKPQTSQNDRMGFFEIVEQGRPYRPYALLVQAKR